MKALGFTTILSKHIIKTNDSPHRQAGQDYHLHHINPQELGEKNEWGNIHKFIKVDIQEQMECTLKILNYVTS